VVRIDSLRWRSERHFSGGGGGGGSIFCLTRIAQALSGSEN
jgi:hypothetical protein